MDCPNVPDTRCLWHDWFSRSFILRLDDNSRNFYCKVCSKEDLDDMVLGSTRQPQILDQELKMKASLQRTAYNLLCKSDKYDAEERVRNKQKRWYLNDQGRHLGSRLIGKSGTPAWQAQRTLHNLRLLNTLAPPRVFAACLSTLFNRWTTARRFQQRNSDANRCVLGCATNTGDQPEDSIEHYCRCRFARDLGSRYLHLDPSTQINMHTFMLCNAQITTCEELVASAILIYAMYRATNHYRHNGDQTRDVFNALRQWSREATMKHTMSMSILDNLWHPRRTLTLLPPKPTNPTTLPTRPKITRPLPTISSQAAAAQAKRRRTTQQLIPDTDVATDAVTDVVAASTTNDRHA